MKRQLTEDERTTITNGLRVAAERFKGHALELQTDRCPHCHDRPGKDGLGRICKTCNGTGDVPDKNPVHKRLADQFVTQYNDSLALADLIDGCEAVELTPYDDSKCGDCGRELGDPDCHCGSVALEIERGGE